MLTDDQHQELTEIRQNGIAKIVENYTDCTSDKKLKSVIKEVEDAHDFIIEAYEKEKSYRKTKFMLQLYNIKARNVLENRYK